MTLIQAGELGNEKEKVLINRKLDKKEAQLFIDFLSVSNLDSFKDYYGDSLGNDGNIKYIKISYNGNDKKIIIENYYEKNLDSLCRIFNRVVPKEYKISLIL